MTFWPSISIPAFSCVGHFRARGVRFGSGERREKSSVLSAEVKYGHVRILGALPCWCLAVSSALDGQDKSSSFSKSLVSLVTLSKDSQIQGDLLWNVGRHPKGWVWKSPFCPQFFHSFPVLLGVHFLGLWAEISSSVGWGGCSSPRSLWCEPAKGVRRLSEGVGRVQVSVWWDCSCG